MTNTITKFTDTNTGALNINSLLQSIPEEQKALVYALLVNGQSMESKIKYSNALDMSQIETTVKANGTEKTVSTRCLIAQFIDENKDRLHNESKLTYLHGLNCLFNYLEDNRLEKPEELDIKNWIDFIENEKEVITPSGKLKKQGLGSSTVHLYLIACKRFFKWTDKKGIYPNIALDVFATPIGSMYGKKEALSEKDVADLLNNISTDTDTGLRNRSIIALESCCGLRDCEISRMQYKDINFRTHSLVIHGKGHEKGGKIRLVGLNEKVERILKNYLKVRGNMTDNDYIFVGFGLVNNNGEQLSAKSVGRIVKLELEKIGLVGSKYSAHSLRHTAATSMFESNIEAKRVQIALGHANLATTEIYNETDTHDFSAFDVVADKLLKEVEV